MKSIVHAGPSALIFDKFSSITTDRCKISPIMTNVQDPFTLLAISTLLKSVGRCTVEMFMKKRFVLSKHLNNSPNSGVVRQNLSYRCVEEGWENVLHSLM